MARDKYDDIRWAENEFSVARAVGSIREQKREDTAARRELNRQRDWVSLDDIQSTAMDEPYNGFAPCQNCFESSGYAERWNPHTWDDPGFYDADPTRSCPHCNGTGLVECDPMTLQDLEDMTND